MTWGAQKLLWGQKLSPRAGDLVLLRERLEGPDDRRAEAGRLARQPLGDDSRRPGRARPLRRRARRRSSAWTDARLRLGKTRLDRGRSGPFGSGGADRLPCDHEAALKPALIQGKRDHKLGVSGDQEPARRIADSTEILRASTSRSPGGDPRAHGPERLRQVDLAYVSMGHPGYEVTEGEPLTAKPAQAGPDERSRRGMFLAFQYPRAVPGVTVANFLRMAINAHRKGAPRRHRRPDSGRRVPQSSCRRTWRCRRRGRPAGTERRLLRRREEAARDPADGDPAAEDGDPRRDRLGPRHRRAADRRRRREPLVGRRWARS